MSLTPPSHWHFASEKVREELKNDPLFLLGSAELVKTNAVRQVYRSGGYYLKLDRRVSRSFCGEFNSAHLCEAEHIPVVEHLCWGRNSEGAWLVTRAADGFVEAADLFKVRQEDQVYEGIALFLKKIFCSKVYHPDLHPGNILIEPATGRCLLVDLHGVRKRNFFDRFRMYMMHRCIMEFRNCRSDEQMFRLIGMCGIENGEKFFKKALVREAALLRALTPKRRTQILNGYFKYTRIEKCGRLVDVSSGEDELSACEEFSSPHAAELFLLHFFLTQAKIPHRRILAFDPESQSCFYEKAPAEQYRSDATGAELCRRLKYNGLRCEEKDFKQGYLWHLEEVFLKNNPSGE